MRTDLITTKIKSSSLRLLRLIAAVTGEKQYTAMERLLVAEAKKLKIEDKEK